MPAYAAVTLPIVVAIGQPPLSVMLAPYTWLPHGNSSCSYYLNARPCLSCSWGNPELDSRLPRDFGPTMNNDPNLPFYQDHTSWSELSMCDFGPWTESAQKAHEKDLPTSSNGIDYDASKVPEHKVPERDNELMNWQFNQYVGEQNA
ncbi:uncharacterized protein PV06_11865 [Exophiala oligosperma]|nr:uncharacterized protein PV06_11865 [Exophiala oligosperma]KIW35796.1 hypothetical protein PV06_11865 [Exophiala oligosperma]